MVPPENHQENDAGTINAIFGGVPLEISKAALKAEARRVPLQEPVQERFRKDEVITFSEADAVTPIMPQSDALVVSVIMANHEVKRVYVDNGATVNILFMDCFQKLDVKIEDLKPYSSLQSFTQVEVKPKGMISLPVTVGTKLRRATSIVDFYVVWAPFVYNIILGHNWLMPNKAFCSTYHLVIKFPTKFGIGEVRGD